MLKKNSDAFEKFQDFLKEVENQFGRKIKRIRSDRGHEYESNALNPYVQSLGIISMKLLHHIHLLLMVLLKEKIEL